MDIYLKKVILYIIDWEIGMLVFFEKELDLMIEYIWMYLIVKILKFLIV